VLKFLRSHSLDITRYATKLPEKEKESEMLKTAQGALRLPIHHIHQITSLYY